MKIFVIIDHWFPNIGGGPVHIGEISSRIINDKSVDISIITSNLYLYKPNPAIDPYPKLHIVRLGPKGRFSNFNLRLKFLASLFIYLLTNDFDALHVHPFFPIPVAKIVCLIKQKPMLLTIHGIAQDIRGLSVGRNILTFLNKIITFYISYSAQIFVNKNDLNIKNINKFKYYIPNGVNIKMFDRVKPIVQNKYRILFVGRFYQEKNIISLIRGFSLIAKKYKNIELLLVGDGEEKKSIIKEINILNLASEIKIHPPVIGKKLAKLYKSSNIFILPSRYEAFPLTILEAWASRLPVLVTKTGMAASIVKSGVNGLFIDGNKGADIARSIDYALRNKKLVNLGKRGYDLVVKSYTWDKAAKETLGIYKKHFSYYEKN